MSNTQKNDFVEIKYSGYCNNELFDSNIQEDLDKVKSESKPREVIVKIGEGMIVKGLDKALEGKEIGKEYEVKVEPKEGFGLRNPAMVKVIPLKEFTSRNIMPQTGMLFTLDESLVKIIAVSGARVTADFNNPMAGKELIYKFKIVRKVEDDAEKTKAVFAWVLRFVPEFEVKDKVIIKGPAMLEGVAKAFSPRFKELVGKELGFELKETKKEDKKEEKSQNN